MESNIQETTFIFLMVIGILVMLALALAFVLFFNKSQKKILTEQMRSQELALKHQEDLLHSNILTQEEERKRIAKELHDDIGSKLNVIFLNMHRLEKYKKGNDDISTISKEVNSLINTTIETTRRISHDLLPPTLEDFGLIEALKELKDNYLKSETISINLDVKQNDQKINDKIIELNLYRIIQELIKNSIVHGESTQIELLIWVKVQSIQLEYLDNGKGFDTHNKEIKRGLGMKNIESRMNMIKAQYSYESAPGNGFKMSIKLDFKK